jgi:hypothetical protein
VPYRWPLSRRLLSEYAQSFNRRLRRHGHLFQNRYKSILCQEDAYLLGHPVYGVSWEGFAIENIITAYARRSI